MGCNSYALSRAARRPPCWPKVSSEGTYEDRCESRLAMRGQCALSAPRRPHPTRGLPALRFARRNPCAGAPLREQCQQVSQQGSSLRATNALQRSDRSQRGNVGEHEVYLQRRKSAPPQRPAPLRQLIMEPGDNAGVGRRGGEGGTGCADVSPEHPAFYGPSDELTWQPQQRPSTCRT